MCAAASTPRVSDPLALAGRRVRFMQGSVLAGPMALAEEREEALESLEDDIARQFVVGLFTPSHLDLPQANPRQAVRGRRHGSPPEPTEIVPETVAFECGGEEVGNRCAEAAQRCVGRADERVAALYEENAKKATELRSQALCACFARNGCTPSCNVAMYLAWSAGSHVRCAPQPPTWLPSAQAFLYGHGGGGAGGAGAVAPTDISRDYFPEFPNSAGHVFTPGMARARYDRDPATWPEGFPRRAFPFPAGARPAPGRFDPYLAAAAADASRAHPFAASYGYGDPYAASYSDAFLPLPARRAPWDARPWHYDPAAERLYE